MPGSSVQVHSTKSLYTDTSIAYSSRQQTKGAIGGRVLLVAGLIANSTAEVAARGLTVRNLGVAALPVTPPHHRLCRHLAAVGLSRTGVALTNQSGNREVLNS